MMTNCKLCASPSQPMQLEKLYYVCLQCELICLANGDILAPDTEKERYLQHNNAPDNPGYVKMFNDFLAKVEPLCLGERLQALDFGSGPGPVLAGILRQKGWDVDIFDPYFAPNSEYNYKKYDLITSTEVMEHVKDPLPVWRLLVNRLEKGSVLAIMTHFHSGSDLFKAWWYRRDPTHICFYNRVTMDWLAQELGLEIVYCDEFKTTVFTLKQ